jgi:hypothetical protein
MKSLYERLDEEILQKMEEDEGKYPSLIGSIEKELKTNWNVDELTFLTAKYIHQYKFGDYIPFDIVGFYKLFK